MFISYSRVDQAFVARLEAGLQARGVRAFIDRIDIEKSEDWWARIQQLIRVADSIVFVLSPAAIASDVALKEVDFAASLNKRFLPVVAADIDGHEVPQALARLNYVYFIAHSRAGASGDFDEAADQLVRALQTDIGWIREHTRLGEAAARWARDGQGKHLLLRGPALAVAEAWLAAQPHAAPVPTPLQRDFISAGRQATTRRLRVGVATAAAVALLAIGLAALAWVQKLAATAAHTESFVRQADLSASLAFRLYEQGEPVLGLKVARSGTPEQISEQTPLRPRLVLALQRGFDMLQEQAGLRHPDGVIEHIAWSPDGQYITTATLVDGARLWRAATGELVQRLGTGLQPEFAKLGDPRLLAFGGQTSADGLRLANQFDHRLKVWDVAGLVSRPPGQAPAALLLDAACPDATMRLVQLSPDGRMVVARCGDGLKVWQVPGGKLVWAQAMPASSIDGVPPGGWDSLAFVKGGQALLMLGSSGARLLEGLGGLDGQQPRLVELPGLRGLSGLVGLGDPGGSDAAEIYPMPATTEVLVVGPQGLARADFARQMVLYRVPLANERGRWWLRPALQAKRVLVARAGRGGNLFYTVLDARTGAWLQSGQLNFTGRNAGAEVRDVDLSDDGQSLAVALGTGALVLRLDRPQASASQAHVQQLQGDAQVVLDEPCSPDAAATAFLRLAPGGGRIALACEGTTRLRLLADAPGATLGKAAPGYPRLLGQAPAGQGMLRLVAAAGDGWLFERADNAAEQPGVAAKRSPLIDAPVKHWQAAEQGDAVYWVDALGRAGAWLASTGALTRFAGHYPQPRALRVSSDGSRAALLTADGMLVHLALGQAQPALQAALMPTTDGAMPRQIPRIRYEIDPGLRSVAFTSKDLRDSSGLNSLGVVLVLGEATESQQPSVVSQRCLVSPTRAPAALLFGGQAKAPSLLYVDRSRSVASAPLADLLAAGATLKPLAAGGHAVAVQPCPPALMQRFVEGDDWSINNFTDLSVALTLQGQRLLYSEGATGPVELLDPVQGRSITDLVDGHLATHPLAVSPGGHYLALLTELGNGVLVIDMATGTLLRRILADAPVDPNPGALAFDAAAEQLHVRLVDGRVLLFALQLRQGGALLKQIRDIGLQPMSDAERREIYEFRKRFARQAPSG